MIPGLAGTKIWKSDRLKRPTGPQQLPHGPEHRLKQYMLPTTNIDESSYSGNAQFILYALNQLQLDTDSERTRLALERLFAWAGDRMTAQRCRQIQNFRQESINGFSRLDACLFIFGLFHALMALGQAMLEIFRGSGVGATFGADIILLSRTGLQKLAGNKRLDFHTVDEFLLHECEAHFAGLFDHLSGCKTEEERADWAKKHSAEDLHKLASQALTEHASSGALELLKAEDDLRSTVIKRQRELLLYYAIRRAIKHGDIDRIEALLPELLFFFIGAGNGNYANEVFELLQLLTHETTPAVRAAILQHTLLVNNLGRADSFYPVDQRQELNNKGLKDYGPPPQNSSWEQYGKVSRVIPFYLDVVEHVEGNITGLSRSHKHKDPDHERDVQALIDAHRKLKVHEVVSGRKIKGADKAIA
ncbi:hypothetical protein FS749_012323 [Ceratobasidium sp. UAMH 11750]|nr:hypothetical protein FS749_012323 [Ceratobasidium sp. UAMH 11750]